MQDQELVNLNMKVIDETHFSITCSEAISDYIEDTLLEMFDVYWVNAKRTIDVVAGTRTFEVEAPAQLVEAFNRAIPMSYKQKVSTLGHLPENGSGGLN